ncbi:fibronectin type III domain-containing protein [Paenirhodobacter populi]|uniref:Uncharacterized protein n=1 Tax=Paenirhodobacter populi TaxID=2306993 RepID=A0A443IQ80_9RHOB|nr:hypothetical protein [Sinirhodobacter populi]RWR08151.1 hypothetical protein D2T33_16125 [Sinirhodobacter populi]
MTRIALSGLSGQTGVTVQSGGQTASATGVLPGPEMPAPSAAYVLDTVQERALGPISVTIAGGWNGSGFGAGFVPGVLSNYGLVSAVTGDRVVVPNLDHYDSYAPAIYAGAELEFRRISDGGMFRVATARVAEADFPLYALLPTSGVTALAGTTFRHRLDSWNRRDVSYWYAVSAVGPDGRIGVRSGWQSYVAGAGTDSGLTVPAPETVTVPTRSEGGSLAAPQDLSLTVAGDATVDLSWSAVPGAAGYVVWLAYSDPATWPATVGEFRIEDLQGGAPQAGDLVIWRKELMQVTADMFCSRVYGAGGSYQNLFPAFLGTPFGGTSPRAAWEVRAWEEGEKPSESLGYYYLRQTVPTGARAGGGIFWSGGTGQTYYYRKKQGDVLAVDVWIRASTPVTMSFTSGQPKEPAQTFQVGTEWQEYHLTSDFAPEPAGTSAYRWGITSTTAEAEMTVEFARLRVSLEGTDYGSLMPALAQSLLRGQKVRDHSLIKTRPATYTAKIVTSPAGEGYRGWTCGQHMDLCRAAEATPWVQLEWALFKEDWLLWAAWLAQNHADFDKIMLEIGNENWNSLAAFWPIPGMTDEATGQAVTNGAVYGMMSRMIYEWLQESPFWPDLENRIELVIGGHVASAFGERAYAQCPEAKYVTVANYNGGWDTGTDKALENGETFRRSLAFAGGESKLVTREAGIADAATALGKVVGTDVFHDLYEAGPGYQRNGLNGVSVSAAEVIVQECVMKSRASAAAQLDAICTAWKRGWLSNWFILARGDYWTSHSNEGVEYLTYAVGRAIGESLGAFRTHDIHALAMAAQDGLDDVAIHAFESLTHPDRWLIAVLNRAIDRSVLDPSDPLYDAADRGLRPVTVNTGFAAAAGCRVFRGGLGNMREHNRYPAGTRLTTEGTYVADPLCVEFDMDWHETDLPDDVGRLVIDDSLGAESGGLRGGNFILIELSGMTRA